MSRLETKHNEAQRKKKYVNEAIDVRCVLRWVSFVPERYNIIRKKIKCVKANYLLDSGLHC